MDVVVRMGNRRGQYMDLILCYSWMVVEIGRIQLVVGAH